MTGYLYCGSLVYDNEVVVGHIRDISRITMASQEQTREIYLKHLLKRENTELAQVLTLNEILHRTMFNEI